MSIVVPHNANWGKWEEGKDCSIRIALPLHDSYPDDFKCIVQIKDATGKVHSLRGNGKFIGNFSPIWVDWKGKSHQLTELLRNGL
jgi:hypothetical protein